MCVCVCYIAVMFKNLKWPSVSALWVGLFEQLLRLKSKIKWVKEKWEETLQCYQNTHTRTHEEKHAHTHTRTHTNNSQGSRKSAMNGPKQILGEISDWSINRDNIALWAQFGQLCIWSLANRFLNDKKTKHSIKHDTNGEGEVWRLQRQEKKTTLTLSG